MNCRKVEKKFSAYLENELSSKATQQLEQHLLECEYCMREFRAFQSTLRMVKEMPTINTSPDFDGQLRFRLAMENSNKVSRGGLIENLRIQPALAFSGVISVLLMLSIGLYFYFSLTSENSADNKFLIRYVMPEVSLKESGNQWSDFKSTEQFPEQDLFQLENLVQPPYDRFNTNYVLRTVSFTNDNANDGM